MAVLRLFRLFLHIWRGVFACAFVFPFVKAKKQQQLIHVWSRQLMKICNVEFVFIDESQQEEIAHALIISNHVSWLDIFVFNSWNPCRFVAKADIRSWPLAGWLSHRAGTVFLQRHKQKEVRRVYQSLVGELKQNERIAFFPEATTTHQGTLLNFHANLFEAAIEAQVPIQPFVLRFVDKQGRYHPAVEYVGEMTFAQSLWRILRSDRIYAELICLPSISTKGLVRRELAQRCHQEVSKRLGIYN